ncbi:MAG: YggS family pyridoxal phosphate-dependent enzyme [Betaproteobacteria bacterium]|nr:YggS family pyridoxal phosphate-dependent enzyme [Betaproteobacteria bacterium]
MATIEKNMQAVKMCIAAACAGAGRSAGEVLLVAVSKTHPPEAVREAVRAGQRDFGENYVQEALGKIAALADAALAWHFIGPIQSNKTRAIAENFRWAHTVDREKIAVRLSDQRPEHLPALQVCIEVNVSGEETKSGVAPEALGALAKSVCALPRIKLRGLMAIPEPSTDMALARRRFRMLRELRDDLNRDGLALDTLSMGMSADLEAAIAEGATIVRVGAAIFGERKSA